MQVDFCFSGWMRNANINTVYNVAEGVDINVESMDSETVMQNLQSGKWAIDLIETLRNNPNAEANQEVFDFDLSK
jgi:hypothetical protein